VVGSLATGALAAESPASLPAELRPKPPSSGSHSPGLLERRRSVVTTGFPQLDALLGPGGIPRTASLALRGDASSGRTTVALRLVAEAQAAGSVVAWLDLERSLDPVEAVARGVRLEWLVALAPADLDEGLAMAGSLLQARTVDMLLVDLPARLGAPAS
jgi:recombination protein RecA